MIRRRPPGNLSAWLAAALIAMPLAAPWVVAPSDLPEAHVCLVRHLTGLPCPGCGLTHAFLAAGRGDWVESFAWHPLGPAVWLLTAAYGLASLEALARRAGRPPVRAFHILAAASMFAIVWGLRLATGALPYVLPWRDSVP